MVDIGTVTGQEIRENRDGGVDVRLLQVRMAGDDIQTVQYMPLAGDDSPPMVEDLVAVVPIGPAFQVALGVRDSVVPSAAVGEKRIYSRDASGAIIASAHLKADGAIALEGKDISLTLNADGTLEIANVLGAAELKADGSWDINGVLIDVVGNLAVPGNLVVAGTISGGGVVMASGTLTADDVVTSSGVDLKTHIHGGVTVGAGQTGVPV